jgi:hypothetical protein
MIRPLLLACVFGVQALVVAGGLGAAEPPRPRNVFLPPIT